jgi:hypothetical protein
MIDRAAFPSRRQSTSVAFTYLLTMHSVHEIGTKNRVVET